ncbi:MAG: helicase-related protein [Pseudohongiellaceae bacterium]
MPRIFDNIDKKLLPALRETLEVSERADFCVGYFNLRGWRHLAGYVDKWTGGEGNCCRLLVGMHITPNEELRNALRSDKEDESLDNQTAMRERRRIAAEFRDQLTYGVPTNEDEIALQQLSRQIREEKLLVKVYLRHALHAKLYLLHRKDPVNPAVGYLGSSNLTLAGLSHQGELNVDVVDSDATQKLADWFEERWDDRWCLDISEELADIIDESWASERLVPPYHVYLKMAYHLAQEARSGLAEFRIPKVFGDSLFDFQVAAVKIAAHHLHKRRGVLIGDVVGLGKSIMATALAKIFEEDFHMETLIICPKNLVPMWEDYVHTYRLVAKVLSISKVIAELPEDTPRYRVVLIDESHNLRNKAGKRWRAIREYIERNESLCILLSATPYNKTYLDLASQLGLFLGEDEDLGIRPEKLIDALGGEHKFSAVHQCPVRSIAAFEKSENADDWRDLMRHYMVRRTRSFVMQHYAKEDNNGKYLEFQDGSKSYFPERVPKTLAFKIDDNNPSDPYARFYSDKVVDAINSLNLPRYGLGNYLVPEVEAESEAMEKYAAIIEGLSRAGTRLMGFCRTNLFKRLESTGPAFLVSIERHILRNFVFIHAIENGLDIPLGTQSAELLDTRSYDEDVEDFMAAMAIENDDEDESTEGAESTADAPAHLNTEAEYRSQAKAIYKSYSDAFHNRFKWLPGNLFEEDLINDLHSDSDTLIKILNHCGTWMPEQDTKLKELTRLIQKEHSEDKVLVFTQFADTARYLSEQLRAQGVQRMELVTGDTEKPTDLAWRFSPNSNDKRDRVGTTDELRVLISTDVLSEGQNLQDCAVIVNYDLPWAIIRLIQRAGRVDRIGQQSSKILCYSFLPADGVERLIRLRERVRRRLEENAELIGSDESFFGGEEEERIVLNLYHENSGILDDEGDAEVDLASYAYQIWKDAIDADSSLESIIESLPNVVYATKAGEADPDAEKGVLVYMRTSQDNDALAWMNESGEPVTQSQLTILNAAACSADTEALPRTEQHHALTQQGLEHIVKEEKSYGGALGRPSGARFKAYERLKRYREKLDENHDMFITDDFVRRLDRAMEEIYRYPFYQTTTDSLNRHLKTNIDDHRLADLILALRDDGRLCLIELEEEQRDPKLICSMGLV